MLFDSFHFSNSFNIKQISRLDMMSECKVNHFELLETNGGAYIKLHPFKKSTSGLLILPISIHELLQEEIDDLQNWKYTKKNMERIRQYYIHSFHMDSWYKDEMHSNDLTARSIFFDWDMDLEKAQLEADHADIFPAFVRLNSVSPKYALPVHTVHEAKNIIIRSERCKAAMRTARQYNFDIQIVLRSFQPFKKGFEFRAFVYRDRVTAICLNDTKSPPLDLNSGNIIERVCRVVKLCQPWQPFMNCVVDIFLSDNPDEIKDQLIEYNSFGAWANASSGLFHWIEDDWDLHNSAEISFRSGIDQILTKF